ncbi:ribokinase [Spirochaetia bacterium]|nr:ribokinase [Spirochaetia bacterium]
MEKSIVILGSINYDIVTGVDRLPQKGETVHGYAFDMFTGGKGANQAVQISLLGMKSVFIGQVGGDVQGQNVLAGIKAKGVDTAFLKVSPEERTGCALITVASDGSNTLVHAPGANHRIPKELIDAAAPIIKKADLLITQNEINPDAVQYGLRLAHEAGVKTLLNPAPAVPVPEELFALLDYIAPNEPESEFYTGILREGRSAEQWRRGNAEWFLKRGVKNVCITLGAQGSYFTDGTEEVYLPAFPIKPVDTTAAGDSFIGGFSFGLIQGWPVKRSMNFANACGSVSVMTKGAQNSIQGYERITAFLREQGALDQ